jgi:hypothetical protein
LCYAAFVEAAVGRFGERILRALVLVIALHAMTDVALALIPMTDA